MNRGLSIFCFLVLARAAFTGCSSKPQASQPKRPLDKIVGKAQILEEQGGATDAALNAGGPSAYLWLNDRRYRLFLKTKADIVHGNYYAAEGVYAQKAIDEIGDPDQGKNGYPLQSSCERIVTTAWTTLSFDDIDATVSLVRARVKRYPARPLFLVARIRPATSDEIAAAGGNKDAATEAANIKEVSVAAEKERAALIEGSTVQPAPLWEPTGGTVRCKVIIGPQGKISELETGAQLCESVQWSQFRYQPPVQAGHPVKVDTEVEVRFEPRK
jgi:hypothetical protein